MYEYIKGHIADIYDDKVILECNGIGYAVFISLNTLGNISKEDEFTKLYIHEHIREDEISFYGFNQKDEREIFKDLLSISGIGPKVSLGMLSKFKINEILKYIAMGDEKALSSAPGIGKKTANRIILELKDKFKNLSILEDTTISSNDKVNNDVKDDAVAALMTLGYNYNESTQLIDKVYKQDMGVEDLIKKSLTSKDSKRKQ
ncbi:Holliday junction branch migration protein RuvA [Alkalibaculum sp. M08DMB]|uniref:Holliday junction branch migration complex subunit RuvA n=1 Tax=Alkalibaculum sporogenes TaxID=2655001 RepID=A0A6A7KDF6_9FIRM|nr:Holliday junction branch migration protein RuvA [Alkalibaculum sporogenes]MPW27053.1 Holliday junction branch migration protein RuvA [Alkalibaculum sporogenes]